MNFSSTKTVLMNFRSAFWLVLVGRGKLCSCSVPNQLASHLARAASLPPCRMISISSGLNVELATDLIRNWYSRWTPLHALHTKVPKGKTQLLGMRCVHVMHRLFPSSLSIARSSFSFFSFWRATVFMVRAV